MALTQERDIMTEENGHMPHQDDPELNELAQLKSAQNLVTVGIIAGPVSMLIGGVFLSLIAVGCSIVALIKVNRLIEAGSTSSHVNIMLSMKRQAYVAVAVSALALVLNAISVALLMPAFLESLQSGDYAALLEGSQSSASSSAGSSSTWG